MPGVILIAIAIAMFQELPCVAHHPPQILLMTHLLKTLKINKRSRT